MAVSGRTTKVRDKIFRRRENDSETYGISGGEEKSSDWYMSGRHYWWLKTYTWIGVAVGKGQNPSHLKNDSRNLLAVSSILLLAIRAAWADRSCFRHWLAFSGLASPDSSAFSRCLKNFSSCPPHRVCAINAFHCRSVGHHDRSSRCWPRPTVNKYIYYMSEK